MAAAAAQKILGRLGSLGVGLAVAGGVAQSALYNGSIFVSLLDDNFRILVDGGQRAVIFDRFSGVKNEV